jgi:hypothetical protein
MKRKPVVRLSKVPTSPFIHYRFENAQYDDEIHGPSFEYSGDILRIHPSSANDADFVTTLH